MHAKHFVQYVRFHSLNGANYVQYYNEWSSFVINKIFCFDILMLRLSLNIRHFFSFWIYIQYINYK